MRRVLPIFLSGVVGLALAFAGLWLYKTLTIPTPDDRMWVDLNTRMPQPMRDWACRQVRDRTGVAQPPSAGCDGAW